LHQLGQCFGICAPGLVARIEKRWNADGGWFGLVPGHVFAFGSNIERLPDHFISGLAQT
jgi:hypothetical protein